MQKLIRVLFLAVFGSTLVIGMAQAQPEIIINQYIDTESGTTPKALELKNVGDTQADFSANTLIVNKYVNGDPESSPTEETSVTSGTLDPAEIMVIGGSDTKTHMNNNYPNVRFVDDPFSFNGNDALEIVYGGTQQDVFGTIGTDPGSAWTGSGEDVNGNSVTVSTADQNIELKSGITSGNPSGWSDPSTRFRRVVNNPTGDADLDGFGKGDPLPVELTTFDVTANGNQGQITWETASETNNAGFVVQHRAPGTTDWTERGFVEGAGTTTEAQSYTFTTDALGSGTHTFRLKQVDTDGTTHFSDPETISIQTETGLAVNGPNPLGPGQTAALQVAVGTEQDVQIALYDVLGQQVRTLTTERATPSQPVRTTLSTDGLASGVYFLRASGTSFQSTQKISIIQ